MRTLPTSWMYLTRAMKMDGYSMACIANTLYRFGVRRGQSAVKSVLSLRRGERDIPEGYEDFISTHKWRGSWRPDVVLDEIHVAALLADVDLDALTWESVHLGHDSTYIVQGEIPRMESLEAVFDARGTRAGREHLFGDMSQEYDDFTLAAPSSPNTFQSLEAYLKYERESNRRESALHNDMLDVRS